MALELLKGAYNRWRLIMPIWSHAGEPLRLEILSYSVVNYTERKSMGPAKVVRQYFSGVGNTVPRIEVTQRRKGVYQVDIYSHTNKNKTYSTVLLKEDY